MTYYCYHFKESTSLHGDAGMLGFYDVTGHVSIRHHTSASVFHCHRTRKVLAFGSIDLNTERNIKRLVQSNIEAYIEMVRI